MLYRLQGNKIRSEEISFYYQHKKIAFQHCVMLIFEIKKATY